jgi:hypothetical protein
MHGSSTWDLFETCDKDQPHTSLKVHKNSSGTIRTREAVMTFHISSGFALGCDVHTCNWAVEALHKN